MKVKLNRKNIGKINNEAIFLLAYDLSIFMGIMSVTFFYSYIPDVLPKILCVFELLLLIIIEIRRKKWMLKEVILGITCVILFFLFSMRSPIDQSAMFIFVFAARKFSFRRIAEHTCRISMFLLILVVFMSQVGFLQDIIFEGYRHAIGFTYVLYAPSILLNVVLLKTYLERENIQWYKLILYAMLDVWFLMRCYAKLSFGLTILVIVYMIYLKLRKQIKVRQGRISGVIAYSYAFFLVFSFVIINVYKKNIESWHMINRVLSGRINYMLKAINMYPVNLFGNKIKWVGNGVDKLGNAYLGQYFYVDNAYVYLTLTYGIIASAIVWIMYTLAFRKVIKNNDRVLMIIFIILSAYFLIDNLKLKLFYNSFWLLLPELMLYNSTERVGGEKSKNILEPPITNRKFVF